MALLVAAPLGTVGAATAEAAGARPVIAERPLTVSDRGVAVVRISCPALGPACRGRAVLRSTAGRRITLGAAAFVLPAGRVRPVGVRLNPRGAKAVAARRLLRAQVVVATQTTTAPTVATGRLVLRRPASPRRPKIVAKPPAATNDRSAAFRFKAVPGVTYECKLDRRPFTRCARRPVFKGLADGDHVLLVRARHRIRGVSAAVRIAWRVGVPPAAPTFGSVGALTVGTPASVSFSSATGGVVFLCSLDATPFVACTSPVTYRNLRPGVHTLAVKARDAAGRESPASVVRLTVVPATPVLTAAPPASTTASAARISFTNPDPAAALLCSVDGGPDAPCTSPVDLRNLAPGAHTFRVKASLAGVESVPATAAWTVLPLLPDLIAGIEHVQVKTVTLDPSPHTGQRGLYFSTDLINVGYGPLDIRTGTAACQSVEGSGRVASQRVFRDADGDGLFGRPADTGAYAGSDIGCIVYHAAHSHMHFQEFAIYELFAYRDGARGAKVSQSDKISYCMIDELRAPGASLLSPAASRFYYPASSVCGVNDKVMGISVGWNDQYAHDRPDQFVPIEGLPAGDYCLQVRTDYLNRLAEVNDTNNDASVVVRLSGSTAAARNAVTINQLRC